MKDRSALLTIFMIVFIDLVGFGIIIPLSPYLATHYGASSLDVGLLMTVYSLMQFVFSPVWGRLSDKIGRRPILLMSLMGSTLSYLGFAFATELWMLYVCRIFAGIFAANVSTAMAYIADVTPPDQRSKNMGIIGAAFGIGFILGPFIGGQLSELGTRFGSAPPFGMSFSALGAAAICFLNWIHAYFVLKESRTGQGSQPVAEGSRIARMLFYFKKPVVGSLMVVFLFSGIAFAQMESTLSLYVKDVFGWSLKETGYAFAFSGFMMAFVQGYLLRKVMPKFGEKKLILFGLFCAAVGLAGIGFSRDFWTLGLFFVFLSLGTGFINPSIMGSISLLGGKDEQGAIMGVTQSLSAIGRILGPIIGGFVYGAVGASWPFYTAGFMMLFAGLFVLKIYSKLPNSGASV